MDVGGHEDPRITQLDDEGNAVTRLRAARPNHARELHATLHLGTMLELARPEVKRACRKLAAYAVRFRRQTARAPRGYTLCPLR